ncbi:hypothetical protein PsorP6_014006 [Peronosclerospora sorghi]|uniref:Uncharacterized protein n=1 Tax=Peronosclerospora sorghi TaxID=230839 RepID=A0ACC0VIM3_9STRA|nr:hypothetical protein PsorP6_014006 [Peronosclerospora sorghi]
MRMLGLLRRPAQRRGLCNQLIGLRSCAKEAIPSKVTSARPDSAIEITWNTLVVGEIVDFHTHPQADRLKICLVDVGDKDTLLQIICGASNVVKGARVPVAKVGTRLALPDRMTGKLKKLKIKKSKLRGEISLGMICSEAELGLADESDGIFILDKDTVVGALVCEQKTIASRLKARGIIVPSNAAKPVDTNHNIK